jgi:hypothetical protein
MSVLSRAAARLPQVPVPLLSPLARGWLRRSFGEPPLDTSAPQGDRGLLGPDSASWRLYADAASIVGGIRSLLVQLTHPLAMAGVAEHSRYHEDPLGRLRDTSAYVAVTTFGATGEALRMIAAVRGAHRRVVGTAPDGRPYDASDPELLTWVSVAGTASWLRSDADFASNPLSPVDRDRFVAEQGRIAAVLDPRVDPAVLRAHRDPARALADGRVSLPLVEEGWLPTTEEELSDRMAWFAPRLAVGPQGRDTLQFLLWPPVDPVLRLGYLPTLAGAIGSLDPGTRRLLGLPLGSATSTVMRLQSEIALIALRSTLAGPSPNAQTATRRATPAAA